MFDILDLAILFSVGCLGGVLAGLLGIGGGVVYVVALSYYLKQYDLSGVEFVKYVVSNSIFGVFFAGVAGSIRQGMAGNYFLKETLLTAIPGIISALIVSYLIVEFDWYDNKKFTIFFVIMLLLLLYRLIKPPKPKKGKGEVVEELSSPKYGITGFFTGAISSLSGLGGGVIIIPILSGLFRLRILKASSISLGIMPFYTFAMTVFYMLVREAPGINIPYSFGYIVFPILVPMAAGVIIFAPVGVKIAHMLPPRVIKIIFGVVMVLVIIKMIYEYYL